MYSYDSRFRTCKKTSDITAITGENVAKYMLNNGYYEGEITCPVYKESYTFTLVQDGAGYRGEFTCGCVDEFGRYAAVAEEEAKNVKLWEDSQLITNTYKKYGGLLRVSDTDLKGTGFTGTMYWRPYRLNDGTMIYFANSKDYKESNAQGSWDAGIIRVNGVLYSTKSKKETNIAHIKKAYPNVTSFIEEYLKDNFTKK